MMRCQTTRARSWPNATMLSYLPMRREPWGTSRNRPVDRVVDVLGDLGDDEAREIRVEARHQACGDDGAGHQLIGRDRCLQPMLVVDFLLGAGLEEGELARLVRRGDGGADEVRVAAGQRQRAVGGAQGGQRCQATVRCDGRVFRSRIGGASFLAVSFAGGALSCSLKNTPNSRAWPAMRASRMISMRSASASGSAAGTFRDGTPGDNRWSGLLSGVGLLLGLDAVVGGRELGQRVRDRLVVDVEELLRTGKVQAGRLEGEQHDERDEDEQERRAADDDLAVDARDRLRPCAEPKGIGRRLRAGSGRLLLVGHCCVSRHTASVRMMRTTRCGAVPSLSSAAANRRSTM